MSLGIELQRPAVLVEAGDAKFPLFAPRADNISILDRHFVDDAGRILQLHGANVGAASKVPNSFDLTHPEDASYVGRPFPLSEAPEHWARLRSWGLTFVRITVTWDAIEHSGPGQYDMVYLDYLRSLLASLKGSGLVAYVCIHQDVWSRYCGGSGAPAWTLSVAGFDMRDGGKALEDSGAAWLHGLRGGRLEGDRGLWPTGYQKLACASMNTFFWGGETFAPSLKVDGVNIQTYLQNAFLGAWGALLDAVADLDTVMGFEVMNEPHGGYIGLPSIDEWNYNTDLHLGEFPSPLQSYAMGAGKPTVVPVYVRSFPHPTRVSKRVTANPDGVRAWTTPCPWEREGVWSWSEERKKAVALQQDYFTKDAQGKPVDFYRDFYYPFVKKWDALVAAKAPAKARLLEPVPNEFAPAWPEKVRPHNFVFAPHWYDLYSMFTKKFGHMTVNVQGLSRGKFLPRCVYFGKQVRDNYELQIRTLVLEARKKLGAVPIVFGECGIPIDLNNEEAFRTGDWKWQLRMLDALMYALENNCVHFNLWNYNPGNRDDVGDDWNAESFSWYSEANRAKVIAAAPAEEQVHMAQDLDVGARLLDVLVRPYAIATAGTPLSAEFDPDTAMFSYRFRDVPQHIASDAPPPRARVTEIFLPRRHYPSAADVKWHASGAAYVQFDYARQRLFVWFDDDDRFVSRGKPLTRRIDVWVRDQPDTTSWFDRIGVIFLVAITTFFAVSEFMRYYTGEPIVDFWF